jgi:hypothetical protein
MMFGSLSFALLSKSIVLDKSISQYSATKRLYLFRNQNFHRADTYFLEPSQPFNLFLDQPQRTSFILFQSAIGDNESLPYNNNDVMELAKLRKEYSTTGIDDENTLDDNPMVVFQTWLNEAIASKVHEPNAMCLATCDLSTGYPSARMVLLKELDDRGFVWYTNYESRKGQDLQNVRYMNRDL